MELIKNEKGQFVPKGSEYFEQAKFTVDDIINQARLKKKPGPLPDVTYQNKTGETFTKSFDKAVGKGSKTFRKLFGEIEDPRYSIFNAIANLSGAARTATYFDDIAKETMLQKLQVKEDFLELSRRSKSSSQFTSNRYKNSCYG